MRDFLAAGGRVVDSSPMYGSSEDVIGDLAERLSRPPMFSATKIWTPGRWAGAQQVERSMRLWGLERFDLVQVHNLLDWRTHLPTLAALKREGRIRYLGVTTSHGRRHDELERIMRETTLDFVQLTYSLADRDAEPRLLPLARDRGIAVIANRPFDGGDLLARLRGRPLPAFARRDRLRELGAAVPQVHRVAPGRDLRDPGDVAAGAPARERRRADRPDAGRGAARENRRGRALVRAGAARECGDLGARRASGASAVARALERGGVRREARGARDVAAFRERERVGAVEDVAGAQRVDRDDRGRGHVHRALRGEPPRARFAAGDRARVRVAALLIDAHARSSAVSRSASPASGGSDAQRARPCSENTTWSACRDQLVDHVGVGDVGVEHARDARVARRVEQRARAVAPAHVGEHRARAAHLVERQPRGIVGHVAEMRDDEALAARVDDDRRLRRATTRAGGGTRARRRRRTRTRSAIAAPAASSPARPQNATRPPRRAIAHAAFEAIPPPTSR